MYATENLDKFGASHMEEAIKILLSLKSGEYIHPYWDDESAIRLYLNERNGFVFVQDAQMNTIAINKANNGRVEGFYCNPETGTEGFLSDIHADINELLDDDKEYFTKVIEDATNIYGFLAV